MSSWTHWDRRNQANDGKDHRGQELKVGDIVAKACMVGRSAGLQIREVTKIDDNGGIYLNDSKVVCWYSGRLVKL